MEALSDVSKHRLIGYSFSEQLLQLRAIDAVEVGLYVGLDHPAHLALPQHSMEDSQRIVGTAPGAEAVRSLVKHGLVDNFQHLAQRVLHYLGLDRTHSDWSRFTVLFRNVHTANRLVTVPLALQPFVQISQLHLEILSVLLFAHAIDAFGSIASDAFKRALQRWLVDQTRQRQDRSFRVSLRSLCYLQQSR